MKIILASTSPRRKNLLEKSGIEFDIVSPNYEEQFESLDFSFEKAEKISLNKALSVKNFVPEKSIILSADTVVVFEGKILLKPKNEKDAFNMLKKLSGNKHYVVTSYTLLCPKTGKTITSHAKSYVSFAKITDEQIQKYIDEFKPLDKAGAYGLQELPDYFGAKTKGSINNVIGLPIDEILCDLKEYYM